MTAAEVERMWTDTLDVVRQELNTPTYKTWFEHTRPIGLVDDALLVSVQNDFARDWLESRYAGLLRHALSQITGKSLSVTFTVDSAMPVTDGAATLAGQPGEAEPVMPDLEAVEKERVKEAAAGDFNPRYTFDSFVMGSSNRFAYASALAVAESPGRSYNPLFIYGGVGLGKTHLLQAIGHYVQSAFPHMKVKYVSSEQFTNDFINSIRGGDQTSFRRLYRTNDVLLIDDIQFLSGKEGTQEEFFHTFNALQHAGKQIVLSSDRPPKDIATLEERLRSRMEWGLITDIQPPDLETRIAILRRKVEAEPTLDVPDDVLTFVADRISSNIRELEGALVRISAFSSLTRCQVDLDLAHKVLKDIFPERTAKPISVGLIQQEVCKLYGISKSELTGSKRSQNIVYPRQVAMYLSRELTDMSLPRIGAEFGGRDHTTVMHATAKIQKLMTADREVYNQVQTLTNSVRQKN